MSYKIKETQTNLSVHHYNMTSFYWEIQEQTQLSLLQLEKLV